MLTCVDGSNYRIQNGINGSSCSVVQTSDGATLKCSDGTKALIRNGYNGVSGINGQDGKDGAASTGYNIVKVIDPCGTKTSFDEVLLQFAKGDIIGHYSDGGKQHFTLLPAGKYMTTDGTSCIFAVTTDGKVVW